MTKQITYNIKIFCDVNKHNVVIPVGSVSGVESESGKDLNMLHYPETEKIMAIWVGKYYSYPKAIK